MNKSDLIRQVAKKTRLTQERAGEVLDSALTYIAESLEAGDDVHIKGFGSLEIRQRKAGTARNFKTGEIIPGKARVMISFSASRGLRDRVNAAKEDRE